MKNIKNKKLMEFYHLDKVRDFVAEQLTNYGINDIKTQSDAIRLTADYVRNNLIVICKWDRNLNNTNTQNKKDLGLDRIRYYHNECKNLVRSVNQTLMIKPYVFFTEDNKNNKNLDEFYKDIAYKVQVPDLPNDIKKCGFNYIPYILHCTKESYKTSYNDKVLMDNNEFIHNKRFALYLDLDVQLINVPDEYLYMISDKIIAPVSTIIEGNKKAKSLMDIPKESPKAITYGFDQVKEQDQLLERPDICGVYSNTCVTLCDLEANFVTDWFHNLINTVNSENSNNTNLEEITFDETANEADHDIMYLYHTQVGENYLQIDSLKKVNNHEIINFHGPEFSNTDLMDTETKHNLLEEFYLTNEMSKLKYKLVKGRSLNGKANK